MSKNEIKDISIPSIDSQPIQINIWADNTGTSANQSAGITSAPTRLRGWVLGNWTTPAGTVTLEVNWKTYYLLYSTTP